MILEVNIFGNIVNIDTNVNTTWRLKDHKTKLNYLISNDGDKVNIILEETITRSSAYPSGNTCPTCDGEGVI